MVETNVDKNLYNERSLNTLNIRELRDMGKRLGISSPTTLKKQDLIEYILKVLYGEVKPKAASQGRPFSYDYNIDEYLSKLKKNSDSIKELKDARLYDDYDDCADYIFKAAAPKDKSMIGKIEQRVVFKEDNRCELRIRQFVESDDDILLDKTVAEKFKLENFDVVEIINSKSGIKIISINGEKVLEIIKPFKINDENILAGSRKVFHLRTKEEIKNNINNIQEICKSLNVALISLRHKNSTNEIVEDNDFLIDENDNEKIIFKKIMMFIEKCKEYIFENKNFVIILENQDIIIDTINNLENDVSLRIKQYVNEIIQDVLCLGNIVLTFDELKSKIY